MFQSTQARRTYKKAHCFILGYLLTSFESKYAVLLEIYCSKCCKLYIGETGRRLPGRFAEYLHSVATMMLTILLQHFNTANHSISDVKVCAISPISGGNDSRKRQEKRLILKIGIIHSTINERFSFI